MPLFLKNNSFAEDNISLSSATEGLEDDIRDGWSSLENQKERKEILKKILEHRIKKNIKPIFISGDYHKGAISEIWYDNPQLENSKKIFGYELIASGLYHEGLDLSSVGKKIKKKIFSRIEAQRVGEHFIELDFGNINYRLDSHVEMSKPIENFGGLTIRGKSSVEPDTLKLVFVSRKYENIESWELDLHWDKSFIESAEMAYTFKHRLYNFFKIDGGGYFYPIGTTIHPFPIEEVQSKN